MKPPTFACIRRNPLALLKFAKLPRAYVAWSFLWLAIASEVVGLIVMKMAVSRGHLEGYVLLYVLITVSYFCLAKAVRSIPVGIAYAIWEGSGIVLITLVSAFVFQHVLTTREILGVLMAVAGILMVNAGEVQAEPKAFLFRSRRSNDAAN